MSGSIKERISHWLGLACIFLAGASAGALVFDPCGMLAYRFGNIERHQAMLTNDAGGQLASEEKDLIHVTPAVQFRLKFDSTAVSQIKAPAFEANPNAPVQFWADHAERGPFQVEAITDADLYRSVLIAHRHKLRTGWIGDSSRINHHSPFTDARARLTRTRSDSSLSWPPRSGISEVREPANGGLSTIEEIL